MKIPKVFPCSVGRIFVGLLAEGDDTMTSLSAVISIVVLNFHSVGAAHNIVMVGYLCLHG